MKRGGRWLAGGSRVAAAALVMALGLSAPWLARRPQAQLRPIQSTGIFTFDRGPTSFLTVNYPNALAQIVAADALVMSACLLAMGLIVTDTDRSRRWQTRHPFVAAVLALGLAVLSLAPVEVSLGLWVRDHPAAWRPDPVLGWVPTPRFTGMNFDFVKNNSMGLRSPEISLRKTPGRTRILILGDSATWGAQVEPEETYSRQLERLVSLVAPHHPVDVVNGALPGYSSWQMLDWMPHLVAAYHPDLVLAGFNNDGMDSSLPDRERSSSSPFIRGIQRLLYASETYLLLRREVMNRWTPFKRARETVPRVPLAEHGANYEKLFHYCSRRGIRVGFMILPSPHPAGYDESDRDLCRRHGLLCVDFNALWSAMRQDPKRLLLDGIHPAVEGHRLMARLLYRRLVEGHYLHGTMPARWPVGYRIAGDPSAGAVSGPRRQPAAERRRAQ